MSFLLFLKRIISWYTCAHLQLCYSWSLYCSALSSLCAVFFLPPQHHGVEREYANSVVNNDIDRAIDVFALLLTCFMISYNSFVFKVIFPSYVGLCTLVYHRTLLSSRLLRKHLGNWREFLGKWFTLTHPLEKELPYVNVFKRKRCRTIIFF